MSISVSWYRTVGSRRPLGSPPAQRPPHHSARARSVQGSTRRSWPRELDCRNRPCLGTGRFMKSLSLSLSLFLFLRYIDMYTYRNVYTYIYIYIYVCAYVYFMYVHMYILCIHVYISIYVRMQNCIQTFIYVYPYWTMLFFTC